MTGRKCSTCKHFEAAPIWRKGWCRNPLLYSPQQSHLVGEDDLDCERGMGNYWEPIPLDAGERHHHAPPAPPRPTTATGDDVARPIYVVSGSSGYSDAGPEPPLGGGRSGGGGGPLNYYAEDRYWTDYLRIAAPILGVLLLVVLFWLWASSFLGDDDDGGPLGAATGTTTIPTIGPTPTNGSTAVAGTPTSPIVITTVTPPAGATNTPSNGSQPTPTPEPQEPVGEIFPGAEVVVANTGGDGANLRADASSSAEIITTLLEGTPLTVTGDAVEADGLVWWPVTGEAGDGWVAGDFLVLAQ